MAHPLITLLEKAGYGADWQLRAISGGCIVQSFAAQNLNGRRFFIKYHPNPPDQFFSAEAAGLKALADTKTVPTPELVDVGEQFLILQQLNPITAIDYGKIDRRPVWRRIGRQLAELHRQPVAQFGFHRMTYCGLTPQPNPGYDCGIRFFAEQRLLFQAELAARAGLLTPRQLAQLETIANRLSDWLPEQPAALVHGDLWSGNVLLAQVDPDGAASQACAYLIDPSVYYGWAEAELAMTRLFGGFDSSFYQAYWELNPFAAGWEQRIPLYNLYHLLNHLNLFGKSYLGQVMEIVNAYR